MGLGKKKSLFMNTRVFHWWDSKSSIPFWGSLHNWTSIHSCHTHSPLCSTSSEPDVKHVIEHAHNHLLEGCSHDGIFMWLYYMLIRVLSKQHLDSLSDLIVKWIFNQINFLHFEFWYPRFFFTRRVGFLSTKLNAFVCGLLKKNQKTTNYHFRSFKLGQNNYES